MLIDSLIQWIKRKKGYGKDNFFTSLQVFWQRSCSIGNQHQVHAPAVYKPSTDY